MGVAGRRCLRRMSSRSIDSYKSCLRLIEAFKSTGRGSAPPPRRSLGPQPPGAAGAVVDAAYPLPLRASEVARDAQEADEGADPAAEADTPSIVDCRLPSSLGTASRTEMSTLIAAKDAMSDSVDKLLDSHDRDLDPSTICTSVALLLSSLEAASTNLSDLRGHPKAPPQLDSLVSHCHELYKAYGDLEQILAVYAKAWTPEDLDVDPPLDPHLVHCILTVSQTLRRLQNCANELICGNIDMASFETADTDLVEHLIVIQDFLPIMKCDLDEFLEVGTAMKSSDPYHYVDSFNANHFHRDSVEALREALYGLKDQLAITLRAIEDLLDQWTEIFHNRNAGLPELVEELRAVFTAVTEALTNHGSEWIEAILGGKLTYNEFLKIDALKIRRMTQKFECLRNEFSYEFEMTQSYKRVRASLDGGIEDSNGAVDASDELVEGAPDETENKGCSPSMPEGTKEIISEMRSELLELRKMFKL